MGPPRCVHPDTSSVATCAALRIRMARRARHDGRPYTCRTVPDAARGPSVERGGVGQQSRALSIRAGVIVPAVAIDVATACPAPVPVREQRHPPRRRRPSALCSATYDAMRAGRTMTTRLCRPCTARRSAVRPDAPQAGDGAAGGPGPASRTVGQAHSGPETLTTVRAVSRSTCAASCRSAAWGFMRGFSSPMSRGRPVRRWRGGRTPVPGGSRRSRRAAGWPCCGASNSSWGCGRVP